VPIIQIPLASTLSAMLYMFALVISVVLYFSCRCRHENFDLVVLAQKVSDQGTVEPTGQEI
jgi:hypothetical protein